MTIETLMQSGCGSFQLHRFPSRKNELLRAWDAADVYLLDYLVANELPQKEMSLLVVNDAFGGLSIPLNHFNPVVITDSYLSMQGILANALNNDIGEDLITIINSLEHPELLLENGADIVLIKLPKSLAMLEDQLHRIRPALKSSTIIIAAGMTKHVHMSTMALFEKIIGPTQTSLARKKSRLIFCKLDENIVTAVSPYPKSYKLPYKLDGEDIKVINHAAVFSQDKLDIGAKYFIENLPVNERYETIVDLGCGNGVVGLLAAIRNPAAKLIFSDESYMAVESSIVNFMSVFGDSREAEFLQTDCLQGIEDNSVTLVLCNPPFHQNNAINDAVAWQMFTESLDALEEQGELWVIGNRHLAYHAKLKRIFGNCEIIASNRKFVIHKAIKNTIIN